MEGATASWVLVEHWQVSLKIVQVAGSVAPMPTSKEDSL